VCDTGSAMGTVIETTAGRSRCWCFTLNNPQRLSEEARNGIKARLSAVRYWVIGEEVGESGTPHWQGFVFTHNQVRFPTVRAMLGDSGAHIEKCKGTAVENEQYCKKGRQSKAEWKEKGVEGPNYGLEAKWEEHGDPPMSQKRKGEEGKKESEKKWRRLYDLAKEGKMEEIGEEFPREAIVCHGHIQKLYESTVGNKKRNLKGCCGLWLEGEANAGKTHKATTMFPGAYEKKANKWWCRYRGEEVVIINDVSPFQKKDITDHLKIWADKYPFPVETKGGGMVGLRPRKIVVTSQYTIDQVWDDAETRAAIHRRFKEVHLVADPLRPPNARVEDLSDDELQGWEEEAPAGEEEESEESCTVLDTDCELEL